MLAARYVAWLVSAALFAPVLPAPMLTTSDAQTASSCGAPERPALVEVFYDAVGDDAGLEFIELLNPAPVPWPLAGLRVEAGDGSTPHRWSLRWTGGALDSIPARGRFVMGGSRVLPAPQRTVALDLQNGPDAVRLVWPDGVIEVLGYGAQEFAEYACGMAAPDVPSGMALARIPEDGRRGSNLLDFRPASATPGRSNQPRRDAAVIPGTLLLTPEQPGPGTLASIRAAITARGAEGFAAGAVVVEAVWAESVLVRSAVPAPVAAAETLEVAIDVAFPAPGTGMLIVRVRAAGDEDGLNDADSARVRIGAGPLAVTEIQFHPVGDEGEWIEVHNRSDAVLDLARFLVGDRGGARATITAGAASSSGIPLAPGSLAVIAQDRPRFLSAFPGLDTTHVLAASPWAALNNSDGDDGFADVVTLRERDGTPCARVHYRASGVRAGVPLELTEDGRWEPAMDTRGSPLAAPPRWPGLPRAFVVGSRRVARGAVVPLEWSLPWPAVLEVAAFDLAGRRVAIAIPPRDAGARGRLEWSTGALDPGLYVLAFHARSATGARVDATQPVRIVGSAP